MLKAKQTDKITNKIILYNCRKRQVLKNVTKRGDQIVGYVIRQRVEKHKEEKTEV